MRQLSPAGQQRINDIAQRHGFSTDAVMSMLESVICSNGKTYSNLCWATVAGATGCVPLWNIPPIPY